MKILGAIIAGGASRRFGADKAGALLGGTALIDHVVAALAPRAAALVVCGRAWGDLPLVADRPRGGLGPLGGLAGALDHAARHGFDAVLSAPCDLPSIPPALLEELVAMAPAVCAANPILGCWPAALAAPLLGRLETADDRSMRGWAAACGAKVVGDGIALPNINRPEDLERLAADRAGDAGR